MSHLRSRTLDSVRGVKGNGAINARNIKEKVTGLFALGLAAITAIPALAGSGSWNKTGSMNNARLYATATLLSNGEVLVAGGGLSDAAGGSAEVYNPASGKWTVTGSMTTPRFSHQAVLVHNGEVLVGGGAGSWPPLSSAELYDPGTGTWTPTGSMPAGSECDGSATLMPNGQ